MTRYVVTGLAVVALLSCVSTPRLPVVESEYLKGGDFSSYRRYGWLATDAELDRTQAEDHRMHTMIRDAIDAQLTARGFVKSDPSDADFLVTYHCRISEKLEAEVVDRVWARGPSSGGSDHVPVTPRAVELSRFDEGSIIIDFGLPTGPKRVWRGVARGRLAKDITPEELRQVVERSVREILAEFPPRR